MLPLIHSGLHSESLICRVQHLLTEMGSCHISAHSASESKARCRSSTSHISTTLADTLTSSANSISQGHSLYVLRLTISGVRPPRGPSAASCVGPLRDVRVHRLFPILSLQTLGSFVFSHAADKQTNRPIKSALIITRTLSTSCSCCSFAMLLVYLQCLSLRAKWLTST